MLKLIFSIHSQLFLLTCLFFSLTVFRICCSFLLPTCQPKMSSLAYLQSILSHPSLCLTSAYTQPATPGITFPVSAIQLFQVLLWRMEGAHREGAAATSFVRMLGKRLCPATLISIVSSMFLSQILLTCKRDLVFDVARPCESDICVAPVQWFLAGGCPQPPGTHDVSWHYFSNKEPRARVTATQRIQTWFFFLIPQIFLFPLVLLT